MTDLSYEYNIIFIGVIAMLTTIIAIYAFIRCIIYKSGTKPIVISFFVTLFSCILFQGYSEEYTLTSTIKYKFTLCDCFFSIIPVNIFLVLLIIFNIISIVIIHYSIKKRKSVLTTNSIVEIIDMLPDGVCFYEDNGKTILTNVQMNKIAGFIGGKEIMNGNHFYNYLKEGKYITGELLRKEPVIVIKLSDESVWSFHKIIHYVNNKTINELLAFDITEQSNLYNKVKENNERIKNINDRLRAYNNEIEKIVAEKETLDIKIRIHDDLGRILLATRAYFYNEPSEKEHKELIKLWELSASVMKAQAEVKQEENPMDILRNAAESVGVEIITDGNQPVPCEINTIFMTALHECLTNTVRHGNGTKLYYRTRNIDGNWIAEFKNNGVQPENINEGNGLSNLRNAVENAGGEMTITIHPEYVLKISLPEEVGI